MLFERGDGTGRELRDAQEYVLTKLREVWWDDKPIVILGQTGLGKSMLARTIQLETDAAIVTPQNTLITQYTNDYPELNYWWGQKHFPCHPNGFHTADCAFTQNKLKAMDNEHTIFNPLSLYYLRKSMKGRVKPHKTVIIDEAHAVLSMIRNLGTNDFDVSEVTAPHKLEVTYNLKAWLEKKTREAEELYDAYTMSGEDRKAKTWYNRMQKCNAIIDAIENNDATVSIKYDRQKDKLHVQNTWLSQKIVDRTFGPGRKILLSGTIFRPDILELLGTEDYHLIEPPSAIPVERRKIYFEPTPFKMNYKTNKQAIAQFVNMAIERHNRKDHRTIVHMPYSWAKEVSLYLNRPNAIYHDKEGKEQALAKFKSTPGAILIACGMAEGVDLKDDLCRLNIVTKVLWPNKGDDFVEKKSLQGTDGRLWYQLEAAKTVIQQAGRSTRGPKDWSKTIVLDPSFANLIKNSKNHLPHSFLEAIVWHRES